MSGTPDLYALACDEVNERHRVFEALGRGEMTAPPVPFAAAMPPGFTLVTPGGDVLEQPAILAHVEALADLGDPGFRIAISDLRLLWRGPDAVLVGYVESQHRGGRDTRRRSTALFLPDAAAPCGVVWRHLQETWLGAET